MTMGVIVLAFAALLFLCWTSYDLDMFCQHSAYQQFLYRLECLDACDHIESLDEQAGEFRVLQQQWKPATVSMVVTHERTGITVSGSGTSRVETFSRLMAEIKPIVETLDQLRPAA